MRPFDSLVTGPGAYAWWYIDAISDDGMQACTLIAFIGSVFSPYYAWSRTPEPENYCAINMVLYNRKGGAWCMTERGKRSVSRTAETLRIGPSQLYWNGGMLLAEIDEVGAPMPRRLRGKLTLTPGALQPRTFGLDGGGHHFWRPIAPQSRVQVAFGDVAWSGAAYFDTNFGDRPLAADFSTWHWSRSANRIFYDVNRADGTAHSLALEIAADGTATEFVPPPLRDLPGKTGWRITRTTRADPGATPCVLRTLEDAPFYARSLIETTIAGSPGTYMHESLNLRRFSNPVVKLMLPFRMPRLS
jgi:carotenoid 1,2-hydratase